MVLEKRRRVKHGGRVEQADWTGLAGTGGQWVQAGAFLCSATLSPLLCNVHCALPASAQCELSSACKCTGLVLPTLFSSATGSPLLYYCVCQWVQLLLSLVASGYKQVLLLSSPCLCFALTISQVDNKIFSYQAPQLKNSLYFFQISASNE